MPRYINADILAKIVFDKWQECDELKHIIPAIRNAIMCASTADVVERKDLDTITEAHEQIGYEKGYRDGYAQAKVEVVRCKECKYFYKASKYCSEFMTKDEDGFCKWGERRDDG